MMEPHVVTKLGNRCLRRFSSPAFSHSHAGNELTQQEQISQHCGKNVRIQSPDQMIPFKNLHSVPARVSNALQDDFICDSSVKSEGKHVNIIRKLSERV